MLHKVKGVVKNYDSVGKFWRDGSFQSDIPEKTLHQIFHVKFTIVSQTNPHIQPFFYNSRGSAGKPTLHRSGLGYRGGFIISSLVQFLRLDLQKWLSFIRDLRLLPRVGGVDSSHVFLQRFEGSLTILPNRPSVWDYMCVLSDPSYERLERYLREGQLRTWPTMCMIRNRWRIEECLMKNRDLAKENMAGSTLTYSQASLSFEEEGTSPL